MKQNKLFIATTNKGKLREFKALLPKYEFASLIDKDIDIIENGNSFKANALIKAKTIANKYHLVTIADDSGICCDALDGAPGIYSHRYANSDNHDDNLVKLIHDLKGKDKNCHYEIAICLYYPNGKHYFFEGRLDGIIQDHFSGDNGFGYDKIFYLEKYHKTVAELDLKIKNTISHRAIATKKLIASGLL